MVCRAFGNLVQPFIVASFTTPTWGSTIANAFLIIQVKRAWRDGDGRLSTCCAVHVHSESGNLRNACTDNACAHRSWDATRSTADLPMSELVENVPGLD